MDRRRTLAGLFQCSELWEGVSTWFVALKRVINCHIAVTRLYSTVLL